MRPLLSLYRNKHYTHTQQLEARRLRQGMRPGITRRDFLKTASLLAVPVIYPCATDAGGGAAYAYVGTYTPNGGGIYLFRLDPATGALTQMQVVDDIRNPTWLAINPAQNPPYAVSEIDNYQGGCTAAPWFPMRSTREFAAHTTGRSESGGATPTLRQRAPFRQVRVRRQLRRRQCRGLAGAAGRSLGEATDVRPSVGPGIARHAVDDPPGQFAVSDHDGPHVQMVGGRSRRKFRHRQRCGPGSDTDLAFRCAGRAPVACGGAGDSRPSGSAPRRFAFHPSGRFFYNLYEHDAKVAVYEYDAVKGGLKLKQSVSALPPKFSGSNLSSEIRVARRRPILVCGRIDCTMPWRCLQWRRTASCG